MLRRILLVLIALGISFTSANAECACGDVNVVAIDTTLQSRCGTRSETVEVVIHNPLRCPSYITGITLSDAENFELDLSFGVVPCNGDIFSVREHQFCTVGVTFTPTTNNGTFQTDVIVGTTISSITSATINGEIVDCIEECTTGECDGKITELTMKNIGNTGHITVTEKHTNAVIYDAVVEAGASFTFSGTDKKGTMGTEIYFNIDGVQNTAIHTSCSQPIEPGMTFGSFEVLQGYSRNGGILGGTCIYTPIQQTCETGNCEGKVTELTMMNMGDTGHITVTEKKTNSVIFDSIVEAGALFTFIGSDKKGTMGTEIYINVDGVQNTAIHTSCSQPIGPNMTFGDFKVVEGYSRIGGALGGVTCTNITDLVAIEKLFNINSTNYFNDINLTNPVEDSHVSVVNNGVVFNNYMTSELGQATLQLDQIINFSSMLIFSTNVENAAIGVGVNSDTSSYFLGHYEETQTLGFIFPNLSLTGLKFDAWWGPFTGSIADLSLTEITNTNLLNP